MPTGLPSLPSIEASLAASVEIAEVFEALRYRSGADFFEIGRFVGSATTVFVVATAAGRGEREVVKGDMGRGESDPERFGVMIEVVATLEPLLVTELPRRRPPPPPKTSRAALRSPERGRDRERTALAG